MIFWLDAQLPPALAVWLGSTKGFEALPVRELGLRDAKDREIFLAAREAGAVVITKDSDFAMLLERFGPPPQIIWLRMGNTSNARLLRLLEERLEAILELLGCGESLIEVGEAT